MENDFKKKLKWIMFEKGLSQAELGAKMGMGQSRISKWITGERTPSLENLEKIAKALNMSAGELIDYELDKKKLSDKDKLAIKEQEINLLKDKIKFLENKVKSLEKELKNSNKKK